MHSVHNPHFFRPKDEFVIWMGLRLKVNSVKVCEKGADGSEQTWDTFSKWFFPRLVHHIFKSYLDERYWIPLPLGSWRVDPSVRKIPWRRDRLPTPICLGFLCGSDGKESTWNAEDLGSTPGLGRSPGRGHGHPPQYSCLENPMDWGAWRAVVHEVAKSQTQLSNFQFYFGSWIRSARTKGRSSFAQENLSDWESEQAAAKNCKQTLWLEGPFFFKVFVLFLTALGLCCCAQLSSVASRWGCSLLPCAGFSLWWPLWWWSTSSRDHRLQ